jgi:hypothetical protein
MNTHTNQSRCRDHGTPTSCDTRSGGHGRTFHTTEKFSTRQYLEYGEGGQDPTITLWLYSWNRSANLQIYSHQRPTDL